MPRSHRHAELPLEDLWPEETSLEIAPERQAAHMRELRGLTNDIACGYRVRDERMFALATSNALSRRDMARAMGLAKSRVDQIIRELAERRIVESNAAAAERVARHLPDTRS